MKNLTIPTKFFHDERIVAIAGEFGTAAQLIVLQLLCELYAEGYYLEWNTLKQNFFARMFDVPTELLCRVVSRLAEYGYFSREMLEKEGVVTCEDVQRRYFRAKSRRKNVKELKYLVIEVQEANDDAKKETVVVSGNQATESVEADTVVAAQNVETINEAQILPETVQNTVENTTLQKDKKQSKQCPQNNRVKVPVGRHGFKRVSVNKIPALRPKR